MKTTTRTIEFWTPGQIDPMSWSVMGVNAKPDSDNPIGIFGTGLKFAIAVFLRLGHEIRIEAEGKVYIFGTEETNFRGKDFQLCTCNGEKLPFTTELGKNWEPWMAYRELVCNTIDEAGEFGPEHGRPEGTTISVTGTNIFECWENHADHFCTTAPLETTNGWSGEVEVHKGTGVVFYRGVRVAAVEHSAFNYNIIDQLDLTEDRTVKESHTLISKISNCAGKLKTPEIIRKIFTNKNGWEKNLSLSYVTFSDEVMKVMGELWKKDPHSILPEASNRFKQQRPQTEFNELVMGDKEKSMMDQAKTFLAKCGYTITSEIKYIENDNDNIVAFVYMDVIHLTPRAFQKGLYDLIQTLMEEHFHTMGFHDESRSFEKYLMDQLITAHNKTIGEPL